jgi:hypothetical protein
MRPTNRLTALVSKLATVRLIDELSLQLSAYARSRPILGQGQRVDGLARCSPLLLVGTSRSAALACLIGITLAASEAKLGPLVQLVSNQNRRRNKVKLQRRFETEVEAASIAAAQIRTLIESLSRCQKMLDCDIATEEERTRCSDDSDPAYSVFARSLIPRRDNVAATIAILQERLSKTEVLTSTGISLVPDQLLPA